jgi:hypothetical protein
MLTHLVLSPITFTRTTSSLLVSVNTGTIYYIPQSPRQCTSWKLVLKDRLPLSRRTNRLSNELELHAYYIVAPTFAPLNLTASEAILQLELQPDPLTTPPTKLALPLTLVTRTGPCLIGSIRDDEFHTSKRHLVATLPHLQPIHRSTLLLQKKKKRLKHARSGNAERPGQTSDAK